MVTGAGQCLGWAFTTRRGPGDLLLFRPILPLTALPETGHTIGIGLGSPVSFANQKCYEAILFGRHRG
jgi:hypothetical protein